MKYRFVLGVSVFVRHLYYLRLHFFFWWEKKKKIYLVNLVVTPPTINLSYFPTL